MTTTQVETGSRIHVTLMDMNGSLTGRVDGGVGLMLLRPSVKVRASRSTRSTAMCTDAVDGETASELLPSVERALQHLVDVVGTVKVEVLSCPSLHTGLGVKTQVLMATGLAAAACHGREFTMLHAQAMLGRGGTSGIGTHGFAHGGLIVDGGHRLSVKGAGDPFRPSSRSSDAGPPPLIARHAVPDWPMAVVVPHGLRIHGELEAALFHEVCPIPVQDAEAVSHIVLMQLLPAVAEADLEAFGTALWKIQERRWKAFEIESQAPAIAKIMRRLRVDLGLTGVAMSSWGTALLCVDERLRGHDAAGTVSQIRSIAMEEAGGVTIELTGPMNHGAKLTNVP